MRKVLESCPTCEAGFEITRLSCTACETVVTGRYAPCRFCKLTPESLSFLETFIKNRGNVKEMERELGISYWTIRNRINDLVADLGFEVEAETPVEVGDNAAQRKALLDQVDRGEVSAMEAAKKLAELK